jgi:hypothetical protein
MPYNNKSNSSKSTTALGKSTTALGKSTTALGKSTTALGKSLNGKKPFCKVCQDAGKPESEYTSHFVRTLPDINGKSIVTCPVLNSTECRYCCQLGHTTKFCPVLEKNEKRNKKTNYAEIQYQKSEQRISAISASASVENKYRGAFAALDCEEDETQAKKDIPIMEKNDYFPALVTKQTTAPSAGNWATIAAKPAPPPQVKQEVKTEVKTDGKPELKPYLKPELKPYLKPELKPYLKPELNKDVKQEVKQEVSEFLKQQVRKAALSTKCWADESDTEDEDDYDIIEAPPPSVVSTAEENDEWDW